MATLFHFRCRIASYGNQCGTHRSTRIPTAQRHDAVAPKFGSPCPSTGARPHHLLDHSVKKFARLFGISVRQKLHRTLHVSEQHRDLLALAFERALGSKDFFSEMFRSIGLGRGEFRCSCTFSQRRSALPQNLFPGGFAAPQAGHADSSRALHSPQNFTQRNSHDDSEHTACYKASS